MKLRLFSTLFLLLIGFSTATHAAVRPERAATDAVEHRLSKKEQRRQARMERRKKRLKKRLDRMEEKLENRKGKRAAQGIFDDSRFRLGAILLLGALVLGLIGVIINLGIFSLLSSLLALAGIILMVWSLVEYYS